MLHVKLDKWFMRNQRETQSMLRMKHETVIYHSFTNNIPLTFIVLSSFFVAYWKWIFSIHCSPIRCTEYVVLQIQLIYRDDPHQSNRDLSQETHRHTGSEWKNRKWNRTNQLILFSTWMTTYPWFCTIFNTPTNSNQSFQEQSRGLCNAPAPPSLSRSSPGEPAPGVFTAGHTNPTIHDWEEVRTRDSSLQKYNKMYC